MTARARRTRSNIAMAVALLSGCGLSLNAFAASEKVIDCENMARNAESLDVPVQELSVNVVDHFPAATAESDETLDLASADAQNLAPVLLLTPRVAAMLDRVFDSDNAESSSTDANEARSPVADRLARQDAVDEDRVLMQDADADEDLELPNVHQRMFRNDI